VTQLEPERFRFTSADGLSIACVKWSGHHAVRRVIQIVHGLGEHISRYAELLSFVKRKRHEFSESMGDQKPDWGTVEVKPQLSSV